MGRYARRKTLIPRIWLTIVAFCQVFLTPFVAFSITYLVEFSTFGNGGTIQFDKEISHPKTIDSQFKMIYENLFINYKKQKKKIKIKKKL